jgi:hypothetical protein
MLLAYALFPTAKLTGIEKVNQNRNLRVPLSVLGLLLPFAFVGFVVSAFFSFQGGSDVMDEAFYSLIIVCIGILGIISLAVAFYPSTAMKQLRSHINIKTRVSAFVMALVLAVIVSMSIEATFSQIEVNQIVQPSPQSAAHNSPTHSISAILDNYPQRIQPDESLGITVLFRLTPYDPNETARRYPIAIDPSHEYGVSLRLRSVGFDVSEPAPFPSESGIRPIEINELVEKSWIIAAEQERSGTSQSIIIDVSLHDLTEDEVVFDGPVTSINIEVSTLLGLPRWFLSPEMGIGTILAGMVTMILPWVLNQISNKNTKDEK